MWAHACAAGGDRRAGRPRGRPVDIRRIPGVFFRYSKRTASDSIGRPGNGCFYMSSGRRLNPWRSLRSGRRLAARRTTCLYRLRPTPGHHEPGKRQALQSARRRKEQAGLRRKRDRRRCSHPLRDQRMSSPGGSPLASAGGLRRAHVKGRLHARRAAKRRPESVGPAVRECEPATESERPLDVRR